MIEIIPRQGQQNNLFERLRDYMSAIDSTWPVRVKPADKKLLERFSQLTGRGTDPSWIPEAFRQTALSIGCDAGGLFKDFMVNTNLEDIISLYEDYQKFEPQAINPDLPIVAKYIIGAQISLNMSTNMEPPIVDTSNGEFIRPRAKSWEAFVMQAALLYGEPRRLPRGYWCSCSSNEVKALGGVVAVTTIINEFATREGFLMAWPSDDTTSIALGQSSSIFVQTHGGGLLLYAFSSENSFLRRIKEQLVKTLEAKKNGKLSLINGALRDSKS